MAIFNNIEFFSSTLKKVVPLTAIVPIDVPTLPGMPAADTVKPLKTVYLLHGFSDNQTAWLRGSAISTLAMQHNVAAIMPYGGNSFYLDDENLCEYYEKFISDELVEFTRKLFPLSHDREDTTIAGLSMGGFGAMLNGLKHNDVFGNIFAFSSALITDEVANMKDGVGNAMMPYQYYRHVFGEPAKVLGSGKDPKAAAKKLVESKGVLPKIYMACGTEDFLLEKNRDFDKFLTGLGIPHEYLESPGVHNWKFWDETIEKAMRWLYGEPVFQF